MAKKPKSHPPVWPDDPAEEAIPAPANPLVIDGPTAQELAAPGSDFMTQALLVKDRADPAPADAVMPDAAFQARELMMVLSLMGVGQAYVASLQRLIGGTDRRSSPLATRGESMTGRGGSRECAGCGPCGAMPLCHTSGSPSFSPAS